MANALSAIKTYNSEHKAKKDAEKEAVATRRTRAEQQRTEATNRGKPDGGRSTPIPEHSYPAMGGSESDKNVEQQELEDNMIVMSPEGDFTIRTLEDFVAEEGAWPQPFDFYGDNEEAILGSDADGQ